MNFLPCSNSDEEPVGSEVPLREAWSASARAAAAKARRGTTALQQSQSMPGKSSASSVVMSMDTAHAERIMSREQARGVHMGRGGPTGYAKAQKKARQKQHIKDYYAAKAAKNRAERKAARGKWSFSMGSPIAESLRVAVERFREACKKRKQ